ncbi:MAG: hypothetical protein HFE83_10530 [Lachnospiraceae bacterium]|nr:hypothetical protein [Lachnospiraceae bacterium]
MDKRRIRFEWPELGLSAYASLADEVNPELCEEIWNALPFESIMNNAVVTDGSMYCWVPVLSFAPVRHKERIDQAPVGRIRYSQNTGNKVIVQYGACNEDVMGAVLGQIDEEDLPTVERVGAEARNAIFMTKKEIHVHISRVNETEKAGRSHETLKRPQTCRKEVEELAGALTALAEEASRKEPFEHKQIRTGKNSGMGSCGQYFSTWEFVYSLSRDLSMYTLYPIARLCREDSFDVRQLEKIYMEIDPTYTNLLGSYGMRKLREHARHFRAMIERKDLTKEEFRYIIDAFTFYTNMLAQWTYFYYPWGIGCACFLFDEEHRAYVPGE